MGHRIACLMGHRVIPKGARMALNDTKLQRLQAKARAYQVADGGGLYIEVHPSGKKVWRMQY